MELPSSVAEIETECQRWLLDTELDLGNSSLTLSAIQWALSLLQDATYGLAETKPHVHPPEIGDRSKRKLSDSQDERSNKVRRLDGDLHGTGGRNEDDGKRGAEVDKKSGDANCNSEALGGYDDEHVSDEIRIPSKQDSGNHMIEIINDRLAVPGCHALIHLIKHCLLLSLDQHIEEATAKSPSNIKSPLYRDHDPAWLHEWLVKKLLSDSDKEEQNSHGAKLDWIVAYLSTASPNLFVKLLLDRLVAGVLDCRARGCVSLSLFGRCATILESVSLGIGEQAATIIWSLVTLDQVTGALDEPCEYLATWWCCYACVWLALGFLSPGLLGACAHLWVPSLSVTSVQRWWDLMQNWNDRDIVLPFLLKVIMDAKVEQPESLRSWLCALLVQRSIELAPVAIDIVVLLSQLQKLAVTSADKYLSETALILLEVISQELYHYAIPQILAGSKSSEQNSGASLFMENLKLYSMRLWYEVLTHVPTLPWCCSKSWTSTPKLSSKSVCSPPLGADQGRWDSKYGQHKKALKICAYQHPLIQIGVLTILCCNEQVIAELLVNSTKLTYFTIVENDSLKKLVLVLNVMRLLIVRDQSRYIFKQWAQNLVDYIELLDNEKAHSMVLAIKKLLDISTGQVHDSASLVSSNIEQIDNESEDTFYMPIQQYLQNALNYQWHKLLSLLHREAAWDLQSTVLSILRLLPLDGFSHPEEVACRVKEALGLYLFWLDAAYLHWNINQCFGKSRMLASPLKSCLSTSESDQRLQLVHLIEQLKRVIIQLATSGIMSFTLMANSLLDYSFQGVHEPFTLVTQNSVQGNSEQAIGSVSAGRCHKKFSSMANWSSGRLNCYGTFELVTRQAFRNIDVKNFQAGSLLLPRKRDRQTTCRAVSCGDIQAASPRKELHNKFGDFTGYTINKDRPDISNTSVSVSAQLSSLLRRTVEQLSFCSSETSSAKHDWSSHPSFVLSNLLINRLQTHHEIQLTKEQYEEVLPKYVSSSRHIFLIDCFQRNPFLFEVVQLIVEKGGYKASLQCVELIRALLADTISFWHSSYRTRRLQPVSPLKVVDEEDDRVQVCQLIQIITMANWLPRPLASSSEIVPLLDGADVADLLLLVWRCMHHALASGPDSWKSYDEAFSSEPTPKIQGSISTGEERKATTYEEWEGQYFAILRKNVARIGAHFAQVYPIKSAVQKL